MKQKTIALLAIAALMCVVTGCSNEDDPSSRIQEKDLVGVWWTEYEYAGVTEDGVPFSRVLYAVDVAADHTGCIYMGVFDDTEENPLYVYGGPKDAAFTWSLLSDGKVALSTPDGSEAYKKYVAEWLAGEEAVCVSNAEFSRLQEMFEFNGIPHYETITPDGYRVCEDLRLRGYENFVEQFEKLKKKLIHN